MMKYAAFSLLLAAGCLRADAGIVEVLLPDGTPAAGATAASVAKAMFLHIKNGVVIKHYGDSLPVLPEDGRITVADADAGRWVFLHPLGWADANVTAEAREISLQPWNTIQGKVDHSVKQGAQPAVSYSRIELPQKQGTAYWTSEAPVNDDGSFTVNHVPSGHGVIGLAREFKIDRRIQRWKDYPLVLTTPLDQPVRVGGEGVEVRGRADSGGPMLATVSDRASQRPQHFGATSADGTIVIPGLLPGDYRIVLRSLDDKFEIRREFTVHPQDSAVDLGDLGEAPSDVEIYRMVEYPEGLIERVREAARMQSVRPIKKIWLGQLVHPVDVWGARVTFEPEPTDDTHAIARTFLVQIPGETIRKFYPEHDSEGYGYRFNEGEFFKPRILEENVRLFPLKSQTLALPIEEPMDYVTALALLKSIEAGTCKENVEKIPPKKNKDGHMTWGGIRSVGPGITREDLPRIRSLRRERPGGPIEVKTYDWDFGGKSATFEERDGEFILLGGGGWVS